MAAQIAELRTDILAIHQTIERLNERLNAIETQPYLASWAAIPARLDELSDRLDRLDRLDRSEQAERAEPKLTKETKKSKVVA